MDQMRVGNHQSSAAASSANNELANLFSSSLYVNGRKKKKSMKKSMKKSLPDTPYNRPVRATRSMTAKGKASLVKGLNNAVKKSRRATKMAVNAASLSQRAVEEAAQASSMAAQVAQAANAQNFHFPGLQEASYALYQAHPNLSLPKPTRKKKHHKSKSVRRMAH